MAAAQKIIGCIAFAIRHEFEQDSWSYEAHEFMVGTLDGGPPRPILIPQVPTFAYSELYGLDWLQRSGVTCSAKALHSWVLRPGHPMLELALGTLYRRVPGVLAAEGRGLGAEKTPYA
jgi:hypothetical protein